MTHPRPWVRRLPLRLDPDPGRVLLRPFLPSLVVKPIAASEEPHGGGHQRLDDLRRRIAALSEAETAELLDQLRQGFGRRHLHLEAIATRHRSAAARLLPELAQLSGARQELLGYYLTQEYALESAALFNPSLVPHPDQNDLAAGELRVVLSLRATGEGHISSIGFRSGVVAADGAIRLDAASPYVFQGDITPLPECEGDGYTVSYDAGSDLSQRTLFPVQARESNGLEDARFVRIEDGSYLGTATAYDGNGVSSQLIRTADFRRFRVQPLEGEAVINKGLAFFPRRLGGRWWMLGRQDSENIHLMASTAAEHWQRSEVLLRPQEPWEFVQLGNCGSPLETEEGWLVLTHGVGPMRQYAIGAALLDLDDPSRVRGRLRSPLLSPAEDERNGYVPNVVYSCGALIHGPHLVLPYAVSDSASRFALVELAPLLEELIASPPRG